jgi:hypothetical protein
MQYYKNTLAVEAGWLIGSGILSLHAYNHMVGREQVTRLNRAAPNTPALLSYESLPERVKCKIQKIVPDPYKAARLNMVEEKIKPSAAAAGFFDEYKLPDGRFLPSDTRNEYYANAIVLEAIGRLLEAKKAVRLAHGKRPVRSWDQIAALVQDMDRSKYPHNLPANPRYLETKYKKYLKEGYMCLIHKNFTNKNAAKVNDWQKEAELLMFAAHENNLDNVQICDYYNKVARVEGWPVITPSTVAEWRKKNYAFVQMGRKGKASYMNNLAMQVKRSAPSYPLYFWTLDGWDVELMYQRVEDGRTTYSNRPTIVVVLDACKKYPIGYAIGTHETPQLIQEALRNAEKHMVELFGGMYRVQQIQSDRYAFKTMLPYYEGLSARVTPARVKNAKAKVVEPYFKAINHQYCQHWQNWSGVGITSKKDSQPNIESINMKKKNFPDFEGVCNQIHEMMRLERESKKAEYLELWQKMPAEHKETLSYEKYLLLFGETNGYTNSLRGNGLQVTICGQKRNYDCFELPFRDHFSTKWTIKYDPDNLEKVLAVNDNGSLQYLLEEKYTQPMDLVERKEDDYKQLRRVEDYNVARIKREEAKLDRCMEAIQGLDFNKKLLGGFLVTDSLGSHKDCKNARRALRSEDAVVVEETGDEFNIYNYM